MEEMYREIKDRSSGRVQAAAFSFNIYNDIRPDHLIGESYRPNKEGEFIKQTPEQRIDALKKDQPEMLPKLAAKLQMELLKHYLLGKEYGFGFDKFEKEAWKRATEVLNTIPELE